MEFEWDPKKNEENTSKHCVSFEEAKTVFDNPLALIFDDESHSTLEEQREIIIGHSVRNRILIVCFTELSNSIRLITARTANRREQSDYESNLFS